MLAAAEAAAAAAAAAAAWLIAGCEFAAAVVNGFKVLFKGFAIVVWFVVGGDDEVVLTCGRAGCGGCGGACCGCWCCEVAVNSWLALDPLLFSRLFGLPDPMSCWCCWANLLASKLVSSNAFKELVVVVTTPLLASELLFAAWATWDKAAEKSMLCCWLLPLPLLILLLPLPLLLLLLINEDPLSNAFVAADVNPLTRLLVL